MNKILTKKYGSENGTEVVVASPLLCRTTQMLAVLCVCGWLAACDNSDGPVERAGERVDETTTDVGNAIEDKCEEAKEQAGAEDTDC